MARKGEEARSSGSGKERREGRSASLDEELQRRDGTELLVKALGMWGRSLSEGKRMDGQGGGGRVNVGGEKEDS